MKTTQMKKLITAFCTLLIVSIGFWACRKQDFKTDDLQIANKELQTWLAVNGGIYKKGEISIKDSKGKLTKASLNWAVTKHTNTLNNDFYEVPFVYTASNSSNTTVLTENEATLPICSIIFQKALNGSLVANVKLSLQASDVLTKAYQTSQYYKIDMFNNINGNRQAYYIWQKASDIKPKRVYPQKNQVDSSNTNLRTFSNSGGIKTVLDDNCMYFVSNNYATDCWQDGGGEYSFTCAMVVVNVTVTSFCFSDGGGESTMPINYNEYYNTQGDNNTPKSPNDSIISLLDSFPCAKNLLSDLPSINATSDSILNKVFGNSTKFNVTFIGDNSMAIYDNGITDRPTKVDGVLNVKIRLNSFVLKNSSQEFKLAVMFHESIHAYINYQIYRYNSHEIDSNYFKLNFPVIWQYRLKPEGAQHLLISNNYVSEIKQLIKDYNLLLSDDMANAIAWEGLQGTYAWRNLGNDTIGIRQLQSIAKFGSTQPNMEMFKLTICKD